MLGAPVDAVEPLHADLSDILVAWWRRFVPTPTPTGSALCVVNDGAAERRNVVCGAAMSRRGTISVRAGRGHAAGRSPDRKRKLRGETSEGMLCSARELGLGQDGEGIWELDTEAAPGTRLLDALPLADHRLVIDVGPNRPDLLGHKGMARELSASYGVPFRLPAIPGPALHRRAARAAGGQHGRGGWRRVGIEDPEGCPRLLGAVLRGVKVGPSPAWLAYRLEAVGVRPSTMWSTPPTTSCSS